MNYRPVILILLMLFSQAAQGMLFAQKTPTVCGSNKHGLHACCAWLMDEQGSAGCGCQASKERSNVPAPASIPASSTRDSAAQFLAAARSEPLFVAPLAPPLPDLRQQLDHRRTFTQPRVRLPVLFCSFLI